ncbi:hypothetical protein BT63DRAFT_285442 [Microthyrium microscopicum]|uniref:Uncharacterized protein n=1 Tax=Microthyrium microscopicum TaxID=703497 RepID=A0A6A6U959_9PEZI|nr:hypothetical protein BT63DRAFT_285442 [Microthyrium microscopicum]
MNKNCLGRRWWFILYASLMVAELGLEGSMIVIASLLPIGGLELVETIGRISMAFCFFRRDSFHRLIRLEMVAPMD